MERREYLREKLEIPANFYIYDSGSSSMEFAGILEDISEGGIAILVTCPSDMETARKIRLDDEIEFVIFDTYELFGEEKTIYITDVVRVVRVVAAEDSICFGCKLKKLTADIEQYVSDRKILSFQSRQCKSMEWQR